ncbi:MAG TPA: lysophospholipid acyltransferase family protein [Candidatus Acidoferrum sp.]|jgi:1-acyl-sn-glycerol-3-phosphate acyltransferase|nr:lysophospholipid acyltransferase family protein [Candidatus Acidoferrum sp.]
MKRLWDVVRSLFLWTTSWLHFLIVVPILIALAVVLDPRKHDWLQRGLCRRIAFFSGARVVAKKSPAFDEKRTSIFMVNHVNLLDPFILYCAIPQLVRGWELESHFKIPIYGWLMKRFGNVPVPVARGPKDLKRLWRLTQEAINSGVSLIIFPEAKRTRDGHLNEFEDGGFRLAQQLGVPIVPVSLVGSFHHLRTEDWILRPTTINVFLHDTIETKGMHKEDVPALKAHIKQIIEEPVEAWLKSEGPGKGTTVSETVLED